MIKALQFKDVSHVACGPTYSVAVTSSGDMFVWGRNNFARLPHADSEESLIPMLVTSVRGQRIVDVACGGADAQSFAVTDTGAHPLPVCFGGLRYMSCVSAGTVFCWDEVDANKSGRIGSDRNRPYRTVESLRKHEIVRVYSSKHFNAALSKNGALFTWSVMAVSRNPTIIVTCLSCFRGKGDVVSVGHGPDENVRHPRQVPTLASLKVVDVAVGERHCLALTDDGECA